MTWMLKLIGNPGCFWWLTPSAINIIQQQQIDCVFNS